MNSTMYNVDLDNLQIFIERLIDLESRFPAEQCQGAVNTRYTGGYEGRLNDALEEIKEMHVNLASLIMQTRKYMENFKSSVETNDATIASGLQNSADTLKTN